MNKRKDPRTADLGLKFEEGPTGMEYLASN
jgi:hypothetical protein